MDLTVAKKDLLKLVTRMQGVAERKSTMPMLSSVLLSADAAGTLRMSATDLYLALSGTVPADARRGGLAAVSAKDLFERVKMMPEGPVVMSTQESGSMMVLKSASTARRFTLHGMPGGDFPPLPAPAEGAPSLSIPADVIQKLIGRTSYAISTDETRAHLNSALLEWDGEVIRMVTTDGHRLSKMEANVPGHRAVTTMLIPLKAIQELRRLCDEAVTEAKTSEPALLTITQNSSNAFFQTSGMTFAVKLVDAQFPPYAQVIPQASQRRVRIARAPFADALRAVSLAASDRMGGVKLALNAGTMRITSESSEAGEGFDEIPVEYDGTPITTGFNARYFLDVLGALDCDDIDLSLGGELDPAVIRAANDTSFLAVVMPMRI